MSPRPPAPTTPLTYERALWASGYQHVAGVDEVGVGSLAGPVVAAAVILPPDCVVAGVQDSKQLSPARRRALAADIEAVALAWAVGLCTPAEIDRINILQASRQAMARAVCALPVVADHLLVDARVVPGVCMRQTSLVHGDSRSQSIAAASILAKVCRDALMVRAASRYPGYGFERHSGYGTAVHLAALAQLGPCPLHRISFAPVRRLALTAAT